MRGYGRLRWCAAIVVVLAGCASRSPAAEHFVAVMAPVNTATASFQASVQRLGDHPTAAQAQAASTPFGAAIQKLESQLSDYNWPTSAKSDVDKLVTADQTLVGALDTTTNAGSFSPSRWAAALRSSERAVLTASTAVRADLGLPVGG